MWMYREFQQVVSTRLALLPLPRVYSRIEMATDRENDVIVLLLRTTPQMSQRMLETPPYHYPMEVLDNTHRIYRRCVADYVAEGSVVPGISELVAPCHVGVPEEDLPITSAYEGAMYQVPQVKWPQPLDDEVTAYDPSLYWTAILMDALTRSQERVDGIPELSIVHIPDTPLSDFTQEQQEQLAVLATGWNYMSMLQTAGQGTFGATFLLGAEERAEVIAEY